MQLKNTDLIAALAVILLNIVSVVAPIELSWFRMILALPLVFVLPGYLLTEILFYRRKMAVSHHLLLTSSLSIVVVIVDGLLLNMFASGLQRISWVLCLSLELATGILIVLLLRGKSARQGIKIKMLHIYEYCLFGLALAGIIFALQYAREGMAQQPHPGFTQFWILQAGQNNCAVRLGIHSFELSSVAYRVELTANGVPIPTQLSNVLQVGEQVERTIELQSVQGDTIDVQARLYRLDRQGEVYRAVNIVLHRSVARCT